jgi:hypothetical protein
VNADFVILVQSLGDYVAHGGDSRAAHCGDFRFALRRLVIMTIPTTTIPAKGAMVKIPWLSFAFRARSASETSARTGAHVAQPHDRTAINIARRIRMPHPSRVQV